MPGLGGSLVHLVPHGTLDAHGMGQRVASGRLPSHDEGLTLQTNRLHRSVPVLNLGVAIHQITNRREWRRAAGGEDCAVCRSP